MIARHGLDALGVYVSNPAAHNLGAMFGTELVRALLPTRNRYSANSQDATPHLLVNLLMFGMQDPLTGTSALNGVPVTVEPWRASADDHPRIAETPAESVAHR